MKLLTRIAQWEHHVERAPRLQLVRLLSLIFVFSLIGGYVLSLHLSAVQKSNVQDKIKNIKSIEYTRMNERIEQLKEVRLIKL